MSAPASTDTALLQVSQLVKHFPVEGGEAVVHACEDVSFSVQAGQTFGVIGESGSGKTTLGRCIVRLVQPTSGSVRLGGVEVTTLAPRDLRAFRRRMHIVFQEPALSMNPQLSVGYQIAEPLRVHEGMNRSDRRDRARSLLAMVGLSPGFVDAHPAALSGGELQRCSIARALAARPELVVLDEPTSALPATTRREIIELLTGLQAELGLTYVFISHDLSLVRLFCDEVAVMYLGSIVEQASCGQLFEDPRHPYTDALLAAQLPADPGLRPEGDRRPGRLAGEIPSPIDLPPGCRLAGRCPHAVARCREEPPALVTGPPGHATACWRVSEGELFLS